MRALLAKWIRMRRLSTSRGMQTACVTAHSIHNIRQSPSMRMIVLHTVFWSHNSQLTSDKAHNCLAVDSMTNTPKTPMKKKNNLCRIRRCTVQLTCGKCEIHISHRFTCNASDVHSMNGRLVVVVVVGRGVHFTCVKHLSQSFRCVVIRFVRSFVVVSYAVAATSCKRMHLCVEGTVYTK